MGFGTRRESSSSIRKEPALVFERFELVQEEPPQLWRIDKESRRDVYLTPLEARILVFLAQRSLRWVTVEALADDVWNNSETRSSSIQVAISRLKKKLVGFEHLIESGASKYRLNTPVSPKSESKVENASRTARARRPNKNPFAGTWYVLAPFFPGGIPLANPGKGVKKIRQLADSTEYKTQDPTICLTWYDYGAAVWVMTRQRSFPSIASFAQEREAHYHEVLVGDHSIRKLTQEILQTASKANRTPRSEQSTMVYALSLLGVEEMTWAPGEVDHALKLLSCPNLLSGYATVDRGNVQENRRSGPLSSSAQQEADFLRLGVPIPDTKPFNLARTVHGYASWAGVAFHLPSAERLVFESEFIQYEARLQAFWLYLDLHTRLLDQRTIRAIAPKAKQQVRKQSRLVFNAEPKEHTPLRLFKEAVIASSRIEQLWESFQQRL